jgi:hypothetical protein
MEPFQPRDAAFKRRDEYAQLRDVDIEPRDARREDPRRADERRDDRGDGGDELGGHGISVFTG